MDVRFTLTMEPGARQRWVDALLSGKYQQGRNALVVIDDRGQETGRCCLGVQAAAEGVPWVRQSPRTTDTVVRYPDPGADEALVGDGVLECGDYPPDAWFAQHFVLTGADEVAGVLHSMVGPWFEETKRKMVHQVSQSPGRMNDVEGASFRDIAHWTMENVR